MTKNGYLTISEFSRISEVSRKALIFYDNIGLFSPAYTGENGYRYYSHEQIYIITVITILKELGTPLNQIKGYMKNISPQKAIELLEHQEKALSRKIQELCEVQDMLCSKKQKLKLGTLTEPFKIRLIQRSQTPLFLSDPLGHDKTAIPDDAWLAFYMKCKKNGVALGYPEGFLVTKEHLLSGQTAVASHILCHVGKHACSNGSMPSGTYLTCSEPGGFEDTEPIYRRLLEYIKENHFIIAGDAFEERLIDEVGALNKERQLIQVSIPVTIPERS